MQRRDTGAGAARWQGTPVGFSGKMVVAVGDITRLAVDAIVKRDSECLPARSARRRQFRKSAGPVQGLCSPQMMHRRPGCSSRRSRFSLMDWRPFRRVARRDYRTCTGRTSDRHGGIVRNSPRAFSTPIPLDR